MASGTQQHQYQQQQQQQQQQQELPLPQQQGNQMQFPHQQQMHMNPTMSPIATNTIAEQSSSHSISIDPQQQTLMSDSIAGPTMINRNLCNQPSTQHHISQHQQKSQLLPLLLSPRSSEIKPSLNTDQHDTEHDQIIEQVISLENDFSEPASLMTNIDSNMGIIIDHQQLQQSQLNQMNDPDVNASRVIDSNQLSNPPEDLLNLLLEFDSDGVSQQMDQDEKVGIETIRKQLMSCEMQSEQVQLGGNELSPILNQTTNNQQARAAQLHHVQHRQPQQSIHQVQTSPHMLSQTAPIITHHQQPQCQLSNPGMAQQQRQQQLPQHHRLSVDQTLLHGSYSNAPLGTVPVSTSGQSYAPHQNVTRISQSTPMSIDNNSPSPSWPQPQLSPYSPQQTHNDLTRQNSHQRQQQNTMQHTHSIQTQQHQTSTTSPQIQQLHHPMHRSSPSQSISPPATTEPSPVVKKNPLLNAQLVNSRAPSLTPNRFINNQTNVLNQNPILNSKLSQGSYVTSSCGTIGSPVEPNLISHPRYILQQQSHPQSEYNYDISQHQQHNTQQLTPPHTGYMSMYAHATSDHMQQQQQHQTNQIFRNSGVVSPVTTCNQLMGGPRMITDNTGSNSGGGFSQQVKQEIRKKVQQPKQQHQTTSLLKQLLSDDNK